MGGDSFFLPTPPSADESLQGLNSPHESPNSSVSSRDEEHLNCESENDLGEVSSISAAVERQRVKVYADVLGSYELLKSRTNRLGEAKSRILSYYPGSWDEKAGGEAPPEYLVPNITCLLLVGAVGSGKSSLVNKISRVLEDDVFASERAQVSYNSSNGEATYFLHEYSIPRGSGSFCLYDTRSLSDDSTENMKMVESWMKKGVRHGELITRKSDNKVLRARLKCKNRTTPSFTKYRTVNFVIFVVNALSILEEMDGDAENKWQYSQMIATNFNNPLLSFKDDKPAVVITHGDLLPLSERVRIRVYLGELLGVSPTGQIFDIPGNDDPDTQLAIVEMLAYCLERADRNLSLKSPFFLKVLRCVSPDLIITVMFLLIAIILRHGFYRSRDPTCPMHHPTTGVEVEWRKIRHMWLGE
ncbi:uncharacterized protein LOC127266679 [Andrographis paniculata]|uniref:uncharacterized protein LOC127266679 n=1 Tax=Andrographis paniculata TaxID=175694 RepID=UPI0021E7334F|nr:uncharacterized protein LOC127266679 [Andrographis paniculata]